MKRCIRSQIAGDIFTLPKLPSLRSFLSFVKKISQLTFEAD